MTGCAATASAHVACAHFRFSTRSTAPGPAPASADASATPWQPTSRNTASEGLAMREVSDSQSLGRKEADRRPEGLGECNGCRLVRLEVDGKYAAERFRNDAGLREDETGQRLECFRRTAPYASDAQGRSAWHETECFCLGWLHANDDVRRSLTPRKGGEPLRAFGVFTSNRQRIPGKKGGHQGARTLGVNHAPPGWRIVQRYAKLEVSRRSDRCMASQSAGELASHRVGAVMTTEKRNPARTGFGARDDRWVAVLVAEAGSQQADQDARRADAKDRPAREIRFPEEWRGLGNDGCIRADLRANAKLTAEFPGRAPSHRESRRSQAKHYRQTVRIHSKAAFPRRRITMEK